MICHYWFLNHGFESQDSVWNDCIHLIILNVKKRYWYYHY